MKAKKFKGRLYKVFFEDMYDRAGNAEKGIKEKQDCFLCQVLAKDVEDAIYKVEQFYPDRAINSISLSDGMPWHDRTPEPQVVII